MSERILVVGDDDQIAAIVRDGLSRMGYCVELAADGPAALAAVRAQPFDLVVRERSRLWRWPGTSTRVVLAETARPAARDGQARHREGQGTRVIYGSGALSALCDEPDWADAWQGRTAWTSRQAGVPNVDIMAAESVCHEGQMVSPRGTTGIRRGTA
jgi:hypothetical protein